jgi:hypothetical protein
MTGHAEDRDHGERAPGAMHETRDISTRVVLWFAVSLVVGAVAVGLVTLLIFNVFGRFNEQAYPREYPLAHVGAPQPPPPPRLQTKPREDLKELRAAEEAVLHSYGWIDPAGGVVHIPIERAMELTLQQGLPTRAQAPAEAGLPARSSSGRVARAGQ